jgi:hypothetical protein
MQTDTTSNLIKTAVSPDGNTFGQSTTDKISFYGVTPVVQGAALTAALTTITPADAAGTPDYAIAGVTNSSPYGFSNAAETITLLYVIKNLQERLAQVEARLETVGLIAAN